MLPFCVFPIFTPYTDKGELRRDDYRGSMNNRKSQTNGSRIEQCGIIPWLLESKDKRGTTASVVVSKKMAIRKMENEASQQDKIRLLERSNKLETSEQRSIKRQARIATQPDRPIIQNPGVSSAPQRGRCIAAEPPRRMFGRSNRAYGAPF